MQKQVVRACAWSRSSLGSRGVSAVASAAAVLVGVVATGHAAVTSATETKVGFTAAGPAGMKIEGTTNELTVAEQGGNIVVTVPLANLVTGIGLRDKHMKEKYLEIAKYPTAVLTVARSALKVPASGENVEADAPGTLQLHGQTKPVSVHYQTKGEAGAFPTRGSFHVNIKDFGIEIPSYLGVTVKPDMDVNASFRAAGS